MPSEDKELKRTAVVRDMGGIPFRLYQQVGVPAEDQLHWLPERKLTDMEDASLERLCRGAEDSSLDTIP